MEQHEVEHKVEVEQEMQKAYLQYSMSVIVGRALPDARDGLKPVHRRVLFAQHEMKNHHNKPYKKSARLVGDVIGKYHPHGDTAVYDTLVRMAQDFSLRYPLVDGQGNFGSIDGDSPAAMRYTEVRMTKFAEELLSDLDKETVNFYPNYDGSFQIPQVLPTKIPNLLTNGSSGIAVGMATNIPPHNLGEIITGLVLAIDNPNISISEILTVIKGPDFPSRGMILGKQGLIKAYKTGRGIITLRGVSHIETTKTNRERVVVTEIPYQVNKAKLIEKAVECIKEKKIEGISDIRDESSRKGMRIVFELKKGESSEIVLNRLYKFTQLQTSFGINLLALDGGTQPKLFDLKSLLKAFIDHRKGVVTKRCIFELNKATARIHVLLGLKKALDHIERVIELIKTSNQAKEAKAGLKQEFLLSDVQAQAILDMRLARLTGLERDKIVDEISKLESEIKRLEELLADAKLIYQVIKTELLEIKDKYGDERRTQIAEDELEVEDEDLIDEEDVMVTFTQGGYIKRSPASNYRTQKRGGRGVRGAGLVEGDFVKKLFHANTLTTLLVFTDLGRVIPLKVYRLPDVSRDSKGRAVVNLIDAFKDEKAVTILPVDELSTASDNSEKYLAFVTKDGIFKRVKLNHFAKIRKTGIRALTIKQGDSLVDVQVTCGKDQILITTNQGKMIVFEENSVRPVGRTASGVIGIRTKKGDRVIGLLVLDKDDVDADIVTITEKGYGKRTKAREFSSQNRGGLGVIGHKVTSKVGSVIGVEKADETQDIFMISNAGQIIRSKVNELSCYKRASQGVRVMSLKAGEKVSSIELVQVCDEEDSD